MYVVAMQLLSLGLVFRTSLPLNAEQVCQRSYLREFECDAHVVQIFGTFMSYSTFDWCSFVDSVSFFLVADIFLSTSSL
jgi:hypothetical protein